MRGPGAALAAGASPTSAADSSGRALRTPADLGLSRPGPQASLGSRVGAQRQTRRRLTAAPTPASAPSPPPPARTGLPPLGPAATPTLQTRPRPRGCAARPPGRPYRVTAAGRSLGPAARPRRRSGPPGLGAGLTRLRRAAAALGPRTGPRPDSRQTDGRRALRGGGGGRAGSAAASSPGAVPAGPGPSGRGERRRRPRRLPAGAAALGAAH